MSSAVNRPRFVLWIDSVGGFLICPGNQVTVGQAVPGAQVDVPLVADVSRHQLTIRRDSEGYVVDPLRDTRLNDRPLSSPAPLADADRLELGPVALRFARPHALSATARLDFLSFHRTRPSCDAVLLVGDSCVLGPKPNSHVVCRSWQREVVLFRRADEWSCHISGAFEIDGRPQQQRAALRPGARVAGEDFAFCLEELAAI